MAVGIYALYWAKPDLIYIGQSKELEVREYEHLRLMRNGKASNYKLQNTYDKYGEPEFIVLQNCLLTELDDIEFSLIEEFDSVNNGLNILRVPFGTGKDTEHASSKYTKEQILHAVELLIDSSVVYTTIKEITGISIPVLSTICNQSKHTWITEEYPELAQKLLKSATERRLLNKKNSFKNNYKIVSPKGEVFDVINIAQFCRENKLSESCLNKVLRNKLPHHCGWTNFKKENREFV